MKRSILIIYKNVYSHILFGFELHNLLSKYKNIEVSILPMYFVNYDKIKSYDAVIPIDIPSQQHYNSLPISPFYMNNTLIYSMLDNKQECYHFVKKYRQINHIPTLTRYDKLKISEFIQMYPSDKYLIKSNTGCGAYFQSIVTKNKLLLKNNNILKKNIIQPLFTNFKLYSLDAVCKNGTIIADLFTIVGKEGVKYTDFIFSSIETGLVNNPKLYYPIIDFCNSVVYDTKYSGLIEFEFIVDSNQNIYFLEINPRICGHVSQKDKNNNSIYFDRILIPYLNQFNINLSKNTHIFKKYSGTNFINIIFLFIKLYPKLFITLVVVYIYVLMCILHKVKLCYTNYKK